MDDKEMIRTLKDRLALQRDVIGRLHYRMNTLAEKTAAATKATADLTSELKWLKGEADGG
jgi:hypothetical protein